jgi:hypothetical protein
MASQYMSGSSPFLPGILPDSPSAFEYLYTVTGFSLLMSHLLSGRGGLKCLEYGYTTGDWMRRHHIQFKVMLKNQK